jgi:hypothetical protein
MRVRDFPDVSKKNDELTGVPRSLRPSPFALRGIAEDDGDDPGLLSLKRTMTEQEETENQQITKNALHQEGAPENLQSLIAAPSPPFSPFSPVKVFRFSASAGG